MMFCPVCGSQVSEDTKFCLCCGTALDKTVDDETELNRLIKEKQITRTKNQSNRCPKCGQPLEPEKMFCTYCGAIVADNRNFEKYPLPNSGPSMPFGDDNFDKRPQPNYMPPRPFGADGFDKRPMPKRASPAGKILIMLIIVIILLVVLYFILFR